MTELARCNGTVVVADGEKVGIVEKGGGWVGTAIFVSVLIGGIATVGGGVLVASVGLPGLVVLAIGLSGIALAIAFYRKKQRDKTAPLAAPWLVFDRAAGALTDGKGARICALADVRIERVFQAGSSSKALAVLCPKKIIVARGTPFGDEVDGVEQALQRALG